MSLAQFIESKWFRALARGCMIASTVLLTVGGAIFTWAILDTKSLVAAVAAQQQSTAEVARETRTDVDAIVNGNTDRAEANDAFQREVRSSLRNLTTRVDALVGSVGKVEGALSAMQRERNASISSSSRDARLSAATAIP